MIRPAKQPPIRLGREPEPASEVEALRAATREAHEAIAGLREALRDVRQERRAVEQLLDGIEGRVKRLVDERIKVDLETAARAAVADLGEATDRAMRASVAKVSAEFDRLERIFTGQEKPDHEPLEALIRRHVAGRATSLKSTEDRQGSE